MKKTIIFLLWIFLIHSGFTASYYVDRQHPSAGDGNSGSLNDPWLTVRHAAETAVAGDSVFIRNGVYHENIYFDNAGNPDQGPIVFAAYPGENPVLDGTGVEESQNGIIIDKDYIDLSGMVVRNWNENAIWIQDAAYFTISDCVLHDVFYGIGVADGCHDFEFNRVTVHHFDLYGFDVSPSGGGDCFNGVFNECVSHTGRDPEQNVDGFALGHGNQHDFILNNCTTFHVYDGFDISSQKSALKGCLAYDCGNGCYKLWQDEVRMENCIGYNGQVSIVELDWDESPGTTTLMNCTFYNSGSYNIWIENAADTLNMYNCILSGGDNIALAFEQTGAGNYHGDHNLFHNDNTARVIDVGYTDEFTAARVNDGSWTTYSGQDAHSLVTASASGIFMDPGNADFHLIAASPAIDAGTAAGAPLTDYDHISRPDGGGFDIGAFEYRDPVSINDHLFPQVPQYIRTLSNYPNPFNNSTIIGYELSFAGYVRIDIYNHLGRHVRQLYSSQQQAGCYRALWNGREHNNLPAASGLYFCRLQVNDDIRVAGITLIR